jgi:hypothetical protein
VPGIYEVRLTVDGRSWSQPLTVAMDPRSSATPEQLQGRLKLARQILSEVLQARQSLAEINSVKKQLADTVQKIGMRNADLKASLSLLDTQITRILSGDQPGQIAGMEGASNALSSGLRVVEGSDREIPSQALTVYQESSAMLKQCQEQWNQLKTTMLPSLNQQLRQANLNLITIPENKPQAH